MGHAKRYGSSGLFPPHVASPTLVCFLVPIIFTPLAQISVVVNTVAVERATASARVISSAVNGVSRRVAGTNGRYGRCMKVCCI